MLLQPAATAEECGILAQLCKYDARKMIQDQNLDQRGT